ncbi:MAG: hypothetical protein JSV71_04095 [Nitrospiraceae bacterium]|nr:MAG: hypothetical protein JSV71_04095 [Nitrospiraceae bacterium]
MFKEISNTFSNKDKRFHFDRRRKTTPFISRYTFNGGRRKTVRRITDRGRHLLVDFYSPRLMITLLAVLIFNYLDSYMTLILLQKGLVIEANPFMSLHLENGISPFVINKGLITAASLTILCIFKNFRFARIGLVLSLIAYVSIVLYEFCLLSFFCFWFH